MTKPAPVGDPISLSVIPSPKASEAVSLVTRAQAIIVRDRASHEACRTFLRGAKALKREIEDHYAAIKRPLNDARSRVLELERQHLAPVEQAIRIAEGVDLSYVRAQEARERAEADANRRQAEAEAQAAREAELAAMERHAAALEESTSELSEREQRMVQAFVRSDRSATSAARAAQAAGYTDIASAVKRLMQSDKLQAAITALDQAAALTAQAKAVAQSPIAVIEPPAVVSAIGHVAGTAVKTYHSCDPDIDLRRLLAAVVEGAAPLAAIVPNMPYLNAEARNLKQLFPDAFPGCKLVVRQGIAG